MGVAKGTAGKKTAGKKVSPARKARSSGKAKVSAKVTSGEKAKGTAGKKAKALAVKSAAKSSRRTKATLKVASPSTTSEASSTLPVRHGARRSARSSRA